ncbi:hypothetical protein BDN72DRAFT_961017 [Pluteus cervinus]|uniref:Uncharacterized protein n=1 Tax=Pluteus cervinus TaxID=181527 RepID=A0ACD3ANW7_9AGAR|nr:hypothetical protein BDN72DRAFT_961017 [Pluteus cervinus]
MSVPTSSSTRESAVHQVLRLPELLKQIFENVTDHVEEGWRLPRNSQLIRAALVCKAFANCTLEVLWEYLPNLEPVLCVLPRDCWNELQLARRITERDCDRLSSYRKSVRFIDLEFSNLTFAVDLVRQLADVFNTAIFPALRSCNWVNWAEEIPLSIINYFTTSTLGALNVGISDQEANSVLSILHEANGRCSNIKDLVLRYSLEIGVELYTVVGGFTELEIVDLPELSTQVYIELMRRSGPGIRTLSFTRLGHIDWAAVHLAIGQEKGFRELQRLDWLGCRLGDITEVQDVLQWFELTKAPLRHLKISGMEGLVAEEDWEKLFTTIMNGTTGDLEELSLSDHTSHSAHRTGDVDHRCAVISCLPLLLELSQLQRLEITSFCGYNIHDADIHLMARSFPNLVNLHLRHGRSSARRLTGSIPTINCLVHFVDHCPLLESLSLSFDATIPITVKYKQTLSSSRLFCLDVGYSPVRSRSRSVRIMADLLERLFPNISTLFCDEDVLYDDPSTWSRVEELMKKRKSAREGALFWW